MTEPTPEHATVPAATPMPWQVPGDAGDLPEVGHATELATQPPTGHPTAQPRYQTTPDPLDATAPIPVIGSAPSYPAPSYPAPSYPAPSQDPSFLRVTSAAPAGTAVQANPAGPAAAGQSGWGSSLGSTPPSALDAVPFGYPVGGAKGGAALDARAVSAWFGAARVLAGVSLRMDPQTVTALIGPSGCGKSTFLRTLNRMHELIPSAQMAGEVLLNGEDIYAPGRRITETRKRIGMVFQKPNPFPAMSIGQNVLAGLKLAGIKASHSEKLELVERSLMRASLWNEVKDRLDQPGGGLSGGQQQRLCIARSLAVQPDVFADGRAVLGPGPHLHPSGRGDHSCAA